MIEEVAPEIKQGLAAEMVNTGRESPKLARSAPKKKNKPMSKHEQDRKIEHLQGAMASFDKSGSRSQEPMPCKLIPHDHISNTNCNQLLNDKSQNPVVMKTLTQRRNKLPYPSSWAFPLTTSVLPFDAHPITFRLYYTSSVLVPTS